MKKGWISFMALMACAAMLAGLTGCTDTTSVGDPQNVPTYEDNKELVLFADGPPPAGEEELVADYFNAGFNTFVLTEDSQALTVNGAINPDYLAAAELISQYGKVLYRNQTNYPHNWNNPTDAEVEIYGGVTQTIPARVITNELNNTGNVLGYYQADEPSYEQIDKLLPLVEWHNQNCTDELFHVNLFPSYATTKLLGGSYAGYIQHYVDTILAKVNGYKTLSMDHYPLKKSNNGNFLNNSYLFDLLTVATIAKTYNNTPGITSPITVGYCIQVFDDTAIRDIECQADIDLQANVCLAMGAKELEYFLYRDILHMIGMVEDGTFKHYNKYDFVKNTNEYLQKWDHVILSFDWEGVYMQLGEDKTAADSAFRMVKDMTLQKLEGVSAMQCRLDTVVGQFKDENGNKGYMTVNYTEPTEGGVDIVRMTFEGDWTHAVVWQNGEQSILPLTDATVELTLPAGGAAFVIPCK